MPARASAQPVHFELGHSAVLHSAGWVLAAIVVARVGWAVTDPATASSHRITARGLSCLRGRSAGSQPYGPGTGHRRLRVLALTSTSANRSLRKRVAQFKASDGDLASVQFIDPSAEVQTITEQTKQGCGPDVIVFESRRSQWLMRKGYLAPLERLAHGNRLYDRRRFYPATLEAFTLRGKLYGYPQNYQTLGLWYNKRLLLSRRVPPVFKTWHDLQNAACRLTGARVFGMGLSPDVSRWFAFVQQAGGEILTKDEKHVALRSTQALTALKFFAGLVTGAIMDHHKKCAKQLSDMSQQAGMPPVERGLLCGSVAMTLDVDNPELLRPTGTCPHGTLAPLGVTQLPKGSGRSGRPGNVIFSTGYGLSPNSKDRRDAWKLLAYLDGPATMAYMVKHAGYLPAREALPRRYPFSVFEVGARRAVAWSWPPGMESSESNAQGAPAFKRLDDYLSGALHGQDPGKLLSKMASALRPYVYG